MRRFALISGVPRAGKSSFADAIVERYPDVDTPERVIAERLVGAPVEPETSPP